jgi:hypothetical protein
MLTKGDILTYLGKASGPTGTYTPPISPIAEATKGRKPAAEEYKVRVLAQYLSRLNHTLAHLASGWIGPSPRYCKRYAAVVS